MSLIKITFLIIVFNLLSLTLFAQTTKSDCSCPVVTVVGPAAGAVESGETATFTANFSYEGQATYNWTVSGGTILEGQGTPSIRVDTAGLRGTTLSATVEMSGDFSRPHCPRCNSNIKASAEISVYELPKPILADKFTHGNCEEVLARMDYFLTQLNNDPSSQGYILIYGLPRAVRRSERIIRNSIKFRNYDPSRITLINGGGNGKRAAIEMWSVPPGATPPLPNVPDEEKPDTEPQKEAVYTTKPYIFGSQFVDGVGGCIDEFYDLESYAEAIKEKSKNRGNIVIYETSQKLFRQTEKEVLGELAKSNVARKRIKTFFIKVKPNQLREGIELWFLP